MHARTAGHVISMRYLGHSERSDGKVINSFYVREVRSLRWRNEKGQSIGSDNKGTLRNLYLG